MGSEHYAWVAVQSFRSTCDHLAYTFLLDSRYVVEVFSAQEANKAARDVGNRCHWRGLDFPLLDLCLYLGLENCTSAAFVLVANEGQTATHVVAVEAIPDIVNVDGAKLVPVPVVTPALSAMVSACVPDPDPDTGACWFCLRPGFLETCTQAPF